MKNITIIGSGLGGLTAGALLAKKGYKVTVLEQHTIVGGSATTFRRKGGFVCEVGLHEMDSVFTDPNKKAIFTALGVYDAITFVRPKEFFCVKTDRLDFVMPDKKDKAIHALCQRYPKETKGIQRYFDTIKSIAQEFEVLQKRSWWKMALFPLFFPNILRYKSSDVSKALNAMIKDEELKLILNTNVGYYHDTIKDFSFLYHAIAQEGYYAGGGWYIKGGSQKLSDYLASIITDHAGEILTKALVTKIEEKGGFQEVTYVHKKQSEIQKSEILISNLSPASTYNLANMDYQEKKQIASSLLTIYIGFNQNIKDIYGKKPYSTFLLEDVSSMAEYDSKVKGNISDRGLVFVDYSQIDAGLSPEGKSFGVLCTTDYLKDWKNLDKEAYKIQKAKVLEHYISRLALEYPNIRDYITFAEVGTAHTMQRYLKTPQGTAYGFAPTAKGFFKIPKVKSKKIKNLYYVGAWVIGGGFTPAIVSGGLCYEEILKN
jgi:phytoene dehydrogenase-like protein